MHVIDCLSFELFSTLIHLFISERCTSSGSLQLSVSPPCQTPTRTSIDE